jgi:glycosyltransferase involved in cell wall biosynthesis
MDKPFVKTLIATITIFLIFLGTFNIAKIPGFKDTRLTENERLLLSAIPVLLYLIFAGRISGFKGWDIEIQFSQSYQKPVFYRDAAIAYIPVEVMEKRNLSYLFEIIQRIPQNKDKIPVLTIEIGRKNYYNKNILEEYLENLIKYSYIRYVVFIRNDIFQGYIDAKQLLYNLKGLTVKRPADRDVLEENPEEGELIIQYIENGEVENIQGASKRYIAKYFSNKQALTRMDEWKTSEIAITDDQQKFVGFTNKETIAASILNDFVK